MKRKTRRITEQHILRVQKLSEAGLNRKQLIALSGYSHATVTRMIQTNFDHEAYVALVRGINKGPTVVRAPTLPTPAAAVVMEIKELLTKIEENTRST